MAIKEDDDKEDDDEVGFNESSVRDKRIEKLAHVNSSCVRDSKENRNYKLTAFPFVPFCRYILPIP